MDKDSHIIFESYSENLEEGLLDRMKARGAGMAQTVGNIKHAISKQPGERSSAADTKADSINKSFLSKIDKELMNFNTRLSKTLNVTNPQQLLATLEQVSPDMANLYTSVQEIVGHIKSPGEAPAKPKTTGGFLRNLQFS